MKHVGVAGGSFPFAKAALLGLGSIGLGVLVGGTAVLVERRAPVPVAVASLAPSDLTLPTLPEPEVDPTVLLQEESWDVGDPITPGPERRRPAAGRRGKTPVAAATDGEGGRDWCGKTCLGELGAPGRIERKLAHEASVKDAAGMPPMVATPNLGNFVRVHLDEVKACWANHGLAVDPALGGHLTLVVRVGAEGKVEAASVAGSTLGVPAVDRCIERRAANWRFPKLDRAATVRYPVSLSVFGAKGE